MSTRLDNGPESPFPPRPRPTVVYRNSLPVLSPANDRRNRLHRADEGAGDANFTKPTRPAAHHQRTRSASAALSYRSRYDENLLTPVPQFPRLYHSRASSVAGPDPAYNRFLPDSFAAREHAIQDFVIRTERSSFHHAMQVYGPPPTRMPQQMVMMPPSQAAPRPSMQERYGGRPVSSSSSMSSAMTNESWEARMSRPASSRTSFESYGSNSWTNGYGMQRPAPIKQFRKKAAPGELFAALPGEVLELILDELKKLHMAPNSTSCATCMMRDLCSVAVSARKWLKYAQFALYDTIHLVGADSHIQKKRYKLNHGTRLTLLRRTLRANTQISSIVHKLKVPAIPQGMGVDEYHNLVASVVMACPNFEHLIGFDLNYDHSFNRVFHALSTRRKLKEINWVIEAAPVLQRPQHRRSRSSSSSFGSQGDSRFAGDLQPQQSTAFLDLNRNWSYLTTLTIQCLPGASLNPTSLIATAIRYMPALQNLHLSNLPSSAFNDAVLLSLPPLKSLSLISLPGVTSAGLGAFATRPSSRSLKKLSLQHINLDSLPALVRVLSNLVHLETFSIVQATTPILPEDTFIWLFPYLASSSLRKLHWDITSHPHCANAADSILARSIAASGFPSLRILRTPNDPDGIFQALCRPVERIERASDKYRGLIANVPSEPTTPKTPTKSPMAQKFSDADTGRFEPIKAEPSRLNQSRRAAQTRMENARRVPRFFVNVIDEDGTVNEKYGMAGFLGTVGSRIHYHLLPDPGALDENGGLVDMAGLRQEGGEDLGDQHEGCTGRWNTPGGVIADKKDRERWWHTERRRWKGLTLE